MSDIREKVTQALTAFKQARAAMQATFSVTFASELAMMARTERISRNGQCNNGLRYFIHGNGYTIYLPSGAEVLIDGKGYAWAGSPDMKPLHIEVVDCFTVYDLLYFLETEFHAKSTIEDLREICNEFCNKGPLKRIDETTFELCQSR